MSSLVPAEPWVEPLTLLDPYVGEVEVDAGRIDALATISAGYRDKDTKRPVVARDGKIQLHDTSGRADGLREALKATGFKSLTIALVHEPEFGGVQQRFSKYSATAIEMFGDARSITVMGKERKVLLAGTPEYEKARVQCKADTFVFFTLAEWTAEGPRMLFPDGFGCYRIRMTSRNSARNLAATIAHLRKFTRGRVAGIPLTISLNNQDVAGPDGTRRNVPVWSFTMRPPGGLALDSRQVSSALALGIGEAQALALPAPDSITVEAAELDIDTAIDEEAMAVLDRGAVDKAAFTSAYFAITKGTVLEQPEARQSFVRGACAQMECSFETDSLKEFLGKATPEECQTLIVLAQEAARVIRQADSDAKLHDQLARSISAAEAEIPPRAESQQAVAEKIAEGVAQIGAELADDNVGKPKADDAPIDAEIVSVEEDGPGEAVEASPAQSPTESVAEQAGPTATSSDPQPFGDTPHPPYEFNAAQKAVIKQAAKAIVHLDPTFDYKAFLAECQKNAVMTRDVVTKLNGILMKLKAEMREEASA